MVRILRKKVVGIVLRDKGRKRFVEEFDKRLRTTIRHRSVGREVSYRRLIRMEIYKIEKHIMGEKRIQTVRQSMVNR